MNGSHWSLPGAGRVAAPRGSWGCPEEGLELCSITPCHPLGLPAGALLSGTRETHRSKKSVADQSVFVLLPWCEGWGAATGRGGLTAPIGPQGL